jgi:N,N'-diacetylchitobiose phosphorylase
MTHAAASDTPVVPDGVAAHLLSADRFTTLVTPAGGGHATFDGFALTRWTPDRTSDGGGTWLYLRDVERGTVWSAGAQPVATPPDGYRVRAGSALVEIVRRHGEIELTTEICVTADAELRRYTLVNHGATPRRLELTTYAEAVLNTAAGDAGHPAFSKLFVQTEWLAAYEALLARRRLRSPDDAPLFLVHRLVSDGAEGSVGYETDRARFIGRGRTTASPRALDDGVALGGGVGNVLDPVLCLRRTVTVAPGATVRLVALLGAAHERKAAEAIAARHATVEAADAAFARASAQGGMTEVEVAPAAAGGRFRPVDATAEGAAMADDEPLRLFNGHGGFSPDGTEYVIRVGAGARDDALPPLPWVNVIANETVGFIASERGAGGTWAANSRENRVTPWYNDPVSDPHGEALYLRDEEAGVFWSPMPGPVPGAGGYEVRHGFGYTTWRHVGMGLEHEVVQWVPRHDPVKLTRVRLTNPGDRSRRLTLVSYAQLVLGVFPHESGPHVVTERDPATGAVLAMNPRRGEFSSRVAFGAVAPPSADLRATTDRTAFLGRQGSVTSPAALTADAPLDGAVGAGLDPCLAFALPIEIAPGETVERFLLLGEAESGERARDLVTSYQEPGVANASLEEMRAFWRDLLTRVQVETPSPAIDLVVNGWLPYQNLCCRIWGRTAFYQSGGAYGFRDQLQDSSALVYLTPELTRRQIVLHASHQFVEGDVLHWWHPPLSKGMRTRFADDLLWLPYITNFYVQSTGDASVLDEPARFVTARPLEPGEDEAFLVPEDAGTSASVYEHCCLALDRSLTKGAHGLPLMGVGDWNDGMNRVGREGRGESVWLGFFLFQILTEFLPFCERRGDTARVEAYRAHLDHLGRTLNDTGWDGAWYRRAYYDDGAPLGSAENDECRIDTIAQAWSVLSGAAPADRAARALDAMEEHLVSEEEGIIRLLTPAFDRTPHDPGYIKGYLPGVRENGGQYTHGALWGVRALAEHGRRERAAPLLEMLSPAHHGRSAASVDVYRTEPYVIAADVYGVAPHVGRGGWTWYTGSAGWMFRVALESVLGLRLEGGDTLVLRPCIPTAWPGFTLRYRLPGDETTYEIVVTRAGSGETTVTVNGATTGTVSDGAVTLPLVRDGATHRVEVALGDDVGPRYVPRVTSDE